MSCHTFMPSLMNVNTEKVATAIVRQGIAKDVAVELINEILQADPSLNIHQHRHNYPNQPSGCSLPGVWNDQSQHGGGGDCWMEFTDQGNHDFQPCQQQQQYLGFSSSTGGANLSDGNAYTSSDPPRYPPCQHLHNPSPLFEDNFQSTNVSTPDNYDHYPIADCLPPPPAESIFDEDPLPPPPPFVSPVYASGNAMLDGAGGYAMLGGSGGNAMLDGAGGNATIGGAGGNAILGGAGGDWRPRDFIEQALVLYDYEAQKADELNLRKQSVVYILRKNEDGWFEGVDTGGLTGLFPGHYVQPL